MTSALKNRVARPTQSGKMQQNSRELRRPTAGVVTGRQTGDGLLTPNGRNQPSAAAAVAVFAEVDALPGAQLQVAVVNGNR